MCVCMLGGGGGGGGVGKRGAVIYGKHFQGLPLPARVNIRLSPN